MSSAFYSFLNSITNAVTSKYDIQSQISCTRLWKIYQGVHRSTRKQVAIFVFEKKSLETSFRREKGASRGDIDRVYDLLKKEASNVARLRHPSILEVVEPMTETRSSIVFVTEPLLGTLSQMISTSGHQYSTSADTADFELDELEIQKGLLQIGKGLEFLTNASVVHGNLTPEAIFVNTKGDWKIGGLGFSIFLSKSDEQVQASMLGYNDFLPDTYQIDLDYAAPELVLHDDVAQSNDVFSLGCVAYAVHNKGVPIFRTMNNRHTYENKIQSLSSQSFHNMPRDLQGIIPQLLARQPSLRITALEFQKSSYFDNLLVSTMKFLESFPEKTREEKSQFMKGLMRVLPQFPERVLKRKVLTSIIDQLKDNDLLPFTLPNIFAISEKLSQDEFCERVLPSLQPIFLVREPPQNMLVLLEKLTLLQEKTPREVFRDDVMPLVYAALESPTPTVQEKALKVIPSLAASLDYIKVKNSLFPRVQALFAQTTILSVKVSTLICFHAMINVLDKFTLQEKLVPLLKNIKTKEPAVMLATLAVYDEMGQKLDKEVIATEILPQLLRMSFGPLLNVNQFKKFMKTIRQLTTRIEEEQTRQLQQVKSLEDQTRSVSLQGSPHPHEDSASHGQNSSSTFEELVQGKNINNGADNTAQNDIFGDWTRSSSSLDLMAAPSAPTPPGRSSFTSAGPISMNQMASMSQSRPLSAAVAAPPTTGTTTTQWNSIPPLSAPTTATRAIPPPGSKQPGMAVLQPSQVQRSSNNAHSASVNDLSAFDPYA